MLVFMFSVPCSLRFDVFWLIVMFRISFLFSCLSQPYPLGCLHTCISLLTLCTLKVRTFQWMLLWFLYLMTGIAYQVTLSSSDVDFRSIIRVLVLTDFFQSEVKKVLESVLRFWSLCISESQEVFEEEFHNGPLDITYRIQFPSLTKLFLNKTFNQSCTENGSNDKLIFVELCLLFKC